MRTIIVLSSVQLYNYAGIVLGGQRSTSYCFVCAKGSHEGFYSKVNICVKSCKLSYCLQVEGKEAGGIKI